jgi:hypothetical protein
MTEPKPATPAQAEELAKKAVADYLNATNRLSAARLLFQTVF